MARHLQMGALVLVPFGILVGLGWWYSRADLQQSATQIAISENRPTAGAQHKPLSTPPLPTPLAAKFDAGSTELRLLPEIRAIAPEVRRCLSDRPSRQSTPVEIRVSFQTTGDGHYVDYKLEKTTFNDPFFEACLEDVFAEMTFDPRESISTGRTVHTFHFEPSEN